MLRPFQKAMMAEKQIVPNDNGIDRTTSEERDMGDRAGICFDRFVEGRPDKVHELCLEAFVHIRDHL